MGQEVYIRYKRPNKRLLPDSLLPVIPISNAWTDEFMSLVNSLGLKESRVLDYNDYEISVFPRDINFSWARVIWVRFVNCMDGAWELLSDKFAEKLRQIRLFSKKFQDSNGRFEVVYEFAITDQIDRDEAKKFEEILRNVHEGVDNAAVFLLFQKKKCGPSVYAYAEV
eukprot:1005658_1